MSVIIILQLLFLSIYNTLTKKKCLKFHSLIQFLVISWSKYTKEKLYIQRTKRLVKWIKNISSEYLFKKRKRNCHTIIKGSKWKKLVRFNVSYDKVYIRLT